MLAAAQEKSVFEHLPVWPSDGKLNESQHGQYVFRDTSTEEVVIVILDDQTDPRGPYHTVRHRPQNQVDPDISVEISRTADGSLRYRYTLANGSRARQSIDAWFLALSYAEGGMAVDHPRWGKIWMEKTALRQLANPAIAPGGAAYWSGSAANGSAEAIAPGQSLDGFSVTAAYLPGLATAYVQGGPPLATPGELPVAAGPRLVELMKESRRTAVTIGPRFKAATDKKAIAADYQEGLRVLAERKVLDPKTPFYQAAMVTCRACAIGLCSMQDQEGRLQGLISSPLEKTIASGLILALSSTR